MISPEAEAKMAAARAARNKQHPKFPMLINVNDGRLIPNIIDKTGQTMKSLRKNANYRVYMGDPKAPLAERMRMLQTQGFHENRAVIDTSKVSEESRAAFDSGKASREELVAFALEQYGAELDTDGKTHLATLRAQVRNLAEAAGNLAG